jgi:hypothetical protein
MRTSRVPGFAPSVKALILELAQLADRPRRLPICCAQSATVAEPSLVALWNISVGF